MTATGRLPVVFPPETDERLSSRVARMASFYAMTVPEFLAELGLSGRALFDLEGCLSEGEGALIAARSGLSVEAIQAMTFQEVTPDARMMIARQNRHRCPYCPADVQGKSLALPRVFHCPVHGADLQDASGATRPTSSGYGRDESRHAAGPAVPREGNRPEIA